MSTVMVPDPVPSPVEDSENLKNAFRGWGTDERAVINILGRRTGSQRVAVAEEYQRLYKETLIQSLQSELSGDFGRAVISWATSPPERDARLIHDCCGKGDPGRTWPMIEVACASSPDHLIAVRQAYHSLFQSSSEEDVACIFSQHQPLAQLLVGLVTSYRYSGDRVDEDVAGLEAARLRDAVVEQQLHRDDVIRILCTRSKKQLSATFDRYHRDFGSAFHEDIRNNRGDYDRYASSLKVAVLCLCHPEKHFAEVLRSSILGWGTDEDSLTRAVVARAEIDMKKIKEEYQVQYNGNLEDDVAGDTSGYYREFLLTLLGAPAN